LVVKIIITTERGSEEVSSTTSLSIKKGVRVTQGQFLSNLKTLYLIKDYFQGKNKKKGKR